MTLEKAIVEFSLVGVSISNESTPTSSAAAAAHNQSKDRPTMSSLTSLLFTKAKVNGETINL